MSKFTFEKKRTISQEEKSKKQAEIEEKARILQEMKEQERLLQEEIRRLQEEDEDIEWHVGGLSRMDTEKALTEIARRCELQVIGLAPSWVAADELRLLIERAERLEEEKKGIADDIRDVYAESKAVGYDTKIMRQIIRLRKMKPDERSEQETILDTYKAALGMG